MCEIDKTINYSHIIAQMISGKRQSHFENSGYRFYMNKEVEHP